MSVVQARNTPVREVRVLVTFLLAGTESLLERTGVAGVGGKDFGSWFKGTRSMMV